MQLDLILEQTETLLRIEAVVEYIFIAILVQIGITAIRIVLKK
jgi:hypothetical protein